jgi:hypothetical protein
VASLEPSIFDVLGGRWTSGGNEDYSASLSSYSGDTIRADRLGRESNRITETPPARIPPRGRCSPTTSESRSRSCTGGSRPLIAKPGGKEALRQLPDPKKSA